MHGVFVTGTDTGVGKTIVAGAMVAALRASGRDVSVLKPVLTGLSESPAAGWPPDHELLARAAGCPPESVVLRVFEPPVSPHLAAELAQDPIDGAALVAAIRTAAEPDRPMVVEGVGGVLVPLGAGYDVRRLASELGLPVVIAARPGLGTINHTLLTVAALRQAQLSLLGVVLTPWPQQPSTLELSNRHTIERLAQLPVYGLPPVSAPVPEQLQRAGQQLPLAQWFATFP